MSGLSVVVATVVDEVSIGLQRCASSHRFLDLFFVWGCIAAAAASRGSALAMGCRGAANVSERCAIARLRTATAVQLAWPNLA